jgi:hypothetical protein
MRPDTAKYESRLGVYLTMFEYKSKQALNHIQFYSIGQSLKMQKTIRDSITVHLFGLLLTNHSIKIFVVFTCK